ncbi:MAG: DUF6159 family protein [Methanospirillum sp.]|uniref:DUF6159 family protein n=1 Tax=Methanospirillum sp. TaxID=45200 RepID=UPI002375ACFC|nr:DUF6159 family protein [Methanospirillum sp.]MDD1728838.1 DUF6159 family protein [Methanospirillum sp.]
MFTSISRSITLIKASWAVLMKDKEILLFPVLSGIICLIIAASFLIPAVILGAGLNTEHQSSPFVYVGIFLFYLITYFVVIFFNAGLVACAHIRLTGGDPTFFDGITAARKNIGQIFIWALISATIGLILQAIRDNNNIIAQVISSFIGVAWSLLTFFVIPVMIIEKRGTIASIQESASLFKRTWGETVIGQGGVALIFILIALIAFVPVTLVLMVGSATISIAVISLYLLLLIILFVIANAMQGVYNTALYLYAKDGVVPDAFSKELIENAFQSKHASSFQGGNI